jgi:ribosomal protein S18 acetylase RimI-like enzyme
VAPEIKLRPATPADADELAVLINAAGEGLPLYLWTGMAAPGEDPWEVGRRRALREQGSFSFLNSVVAEIDGKVAGCLIGYPLSKEPEQSVTPDTPPMFVPLLELEALAPDTWYVNVIAVHPDFRGQGIGSRLLAEAERAARETGKSGLSLIVADANDGARRLYARIGYREIASRPIVREQWQTGSRNWVLMAKPSAGGERQ